MKLIFLDIDGVLNNVPSHDNPATMNRKYMLRIAPECAAVLDWLVKETGASIVVSSSLRCGWTGQEWTSCLRDVGVPSAVVVGETPRLERWENGIYIGMKRGNEIDAWLQENGTPESFVILDDDRDMVMHQHRLVRTDYQNGLTMTEAKRAKGMLA